MPTSIVSYENSATVPAGNVIRTEPVPGPVGSAQVINIVVSLGSGQTAVPTLTGLNIVNAEAAIATALLVKGTITYAVYPQNLYVITAQSPSPAAVVSVGSAVNYTVAVAASVVNEKSRGRRR